MMIRISFIFCVHTMSLILRTLVFWTIIYYLIQLSIGPCLFSLQLRLLCVVMKSLNFNINFVNCRGLNWTPPERTQNTRNGVFLIPDVFESFCRSYLSDNCVGLSYGQSTFDQLRLYLATVMVKCPIILLVIPRPLSLGLFFIKNPYSVFRKFQFQPEINGPEDNFQRYAKEH